ncbi:hypothetical protein GGX14DRAFT_654533 [Mycena pura]|uniref:Uncharacterized protein n=1 Tax=Mycena pura TaxID=153505 RepID=A0AAD6V6C1_9AGAR|nr:hypothetical protein GGX14DRAFT_654533 [Mycena pura]
MRRPRAKGPPCAIHDLSPVSAPGSTHYLPHSRPSALAPWRLNVVVYSRDPTPPGAERMHALSFELPHPESLSLSSDAVKIARALGRCINLKELSVYCEGHHIFSPSPVAIQGWIVSKCPFRLTKFTNAYFRNSFLSGFWSAQAEIRVLSLPAFAQTFPCYDDQLPNLIAVEAADLQALPTGRPLQRIQVGFPRDFQDFSILARFSPTLTTLNLFQGYRNYTFYLRTVEIVARHLPMLLHFGIGEICTLHTQIQASDESPLPALAKLTRLETLFLYTHNIATFRDATNNILYPVNTPLDLKTFGLAIMDACPQLLQAAIGAHVYRTAIQERKGDKGSELTCTLTRSEVGEVLSLNGTGFEFPAVSKFWEP